MCLLDDGRGPCRAFEDLQKENERLRASRPEYICGRGEWRAGSGAIVTQWHSTKSAATKEFFKLVHDRFVKSLIANRDEYAGVQPPISSEMTNAR